MLKSVSKIDEMEIIKIFEKPEFKNIKNIFIASDFGSLGIIKNKKYTLNFIHNLLNKVNENINIVDNELMPLYINSIEDLQK